MKLYKLNYRFIKLKKMNFILSTVILLIGLISMNYMVSFIESNVSTLRIISSLDSNSYIYFVHQDPFLRQLIVEDDTANIQEGLSYDELVDQKISKLSSEPIVGKVSVSGGVVTTDKNKERYFYIKQMSPELENIIHVPLAKGRWCRSSEEGIIEAVVSNQNHEFHVGEIVEMKMKNGDNTYQVLITGILDDRQLEFTLSIGGDELCSLDFLCPYDEAETNSTLAYIPSSVQLDKTQNEQGRILIYSNDTSKDEFKKEMDWLANFGYVINKDDLKNGTNAQIHTALSRLLPTSILLFIIVILGLTSGAILTILEYRNHFAVFFILGCTWIQCIIINILYICSSVSLSLILFSIYQVAIAKNHFSNCNMISTIALCMFIIVLAAIIPYQNMKKMSPKELLVLENER